MADETTTTFSDLLRSHRGPLVENMRWKTVFLSEVARDMSEENWDGSDVSFPIIMSPLQGGTMLTETGTVNTPKVLDSEKATLGSAISAFPISFTKKLVAASRNPNDTSWAKVVPLKMRMAEEAIKKMINEQALGNSDALIAAITASTNTTAATVSATANWHQLYPGRVVDVKTRSSGTTVTNGSSRTILSVNRTTGVVTLDAGGGNVNVTNLEGLYIEGSYGNALQGFVSAAATTGIFENINKANVPGWQGTDASPSSASDLTQTILNKLERELGNFAGTTPRFYIADPAVIDLYTDNLTLQARWSGEVGTLKSGWTGVQYRNKILVGDYDAAAGYVYGPATEDIRIYTLDPGPDWDDDTGSIFQRFSRVLYVEAWLTWMLQIGYHRCISQGIIGNLNQAA